MPRLSNEDRARAVGMLQAGVSQRRVARLLGCDHRAIGRLLDRYTLTGTVRDRPRSGQPRVTTPAQDRYLLVQHLRDRFRSATQTARETRGTRGPLSRNTVSRRLHAAGLSNRRPRIGPELTRERREARLQWCQRHERWTRRDWDQVLFSDESRFCLRHVDGRNRVWRRPGEAYADCCVVETDRWGGGSLMVWGGITTNHRTALHVFDGHVNANTYLHDVLGGLVVPFFAANNDVGTFQQDNARPHTARVCTDFLNNQQFATLPWPPYSPDFSPIEHLWDQLGRRVNARENIDTLADLRQALIQEWNNLDQASIARLIHSMRRRIQACIACRGGHIPY